MVTIAASFLDLMGGVLCGTIFSTFSFGIISIQTWLYLRNFPHDALTTKLSVALLWALHGFQAYCSTQVIYWYLVATPSNPSVPHPTIWQARIPMLPNVFTSFAMQTYLTWRIYQLSRSRLLALFNATITISAFVFGIVLFAALSWHATDAWIHTPVWAVLTWILHCAFLDTELAVTMCVLLWRRRTGTQRADKAIMHMMKHVVNSGVMTSVASIFLAAFILANESKLILFLGQCYGNLYTIALLSVLHSRARLRGVSDDARLRTLGGHRGENIIVTVARETQRASFHYGEPEIAVQSRIASRYPYVESRKYSSPISTSKKSDLQTDGYDSEPPAEEQFEDTTIGDILGAHHDQIH